MRKLFSLFLALVATTSLWAYDFQVGDLYYNITSSSAPYTVEVSGAERSITSAVIPSTVTYNSTTYSLTSIGGGAFYYCSSLTSVTIPNSVTSIGEEAFAGCSSLTTPVYNAHCFAYMPTSFKGAYVIPEGIKQIAGGAFSGCSSLTSITIPNSVTSIGDAAFYKCSSLTSVTIPNSVTSIGGSAFSDCTSLRSVTIPNSVTKIGAHVFYGCSSLTSITIPNSVTSIDYYAFGYCSSLTSITIPNSVRYIGYAIFVGCSALTSIEVQAGNSHYDSRDNCNAIIETVSNTLIVGCSNTIIPSSVTSIGFRAFLNSGVISITIPNSVTNIGDDAFAGCSSLTSITIPNSVTSIGESAFSGCSSLTSIKVKARNSRYDSRDNCNAIIETASNTLIVGCSNTIIPSSVTSIGESAFSNIQSLTSINIPNNIKSIESGSFFNCTSLKSVTIGNSVTSIRFSAFGYCSSLDTVTCLAMTPPTLGENVFDECDNPTLFVPCEALPDYQAHEQWGQFTTIECIASEEAETEEVVIESGTTTVIITWPTEEGADTYTIVIKKDGEVVCTLTFNSEGQLISIAFAPGRDGNHPAQYAEAVANGGYRFTVTGLEEGTDYTYDITVKNEANQVIKTHSGKFTTEPYSAVDNTYSQSSNTNCQKLFRNGQLIILRDGVEYNAMGAEIR